MNNISNISNISNIINEINKENGSNYKIDVLKKHKDNELLKKVLKMTYCKVSYIYGISMKNIPVILNDLGKITLEEAVDSLEKLADRTYTGNAAIQYLTNILNSLDEMDSQIIKGIINRDLRINMGRSNINKVYKNLIVKPPYQRCDIGTEVNIKKNLNFNETVYSQTKMDGTYRSVLIDQGITIMSRSGQEDSFPVIEEQLKTLELDGYVLLGELTLKGNQDRSKGNGLINSDNVPHEDVLFTVWDMIPIQEYSMNKDQIRLSTKNGTLSLYKDRLSLLENTIVNLDNVEVIEYRIVKNMKEAYIHFQEITKRGDEGTVLKAHNMVWKDGTSKQQLKVKLQIDAEMRCTGFTQGSIGTKREKTFGALMFENDEGTIKGQTSGFTDAQIEEFNNNRSKYIGKVMTVEFNDLTKSRGNDYYALSHPRFIEFRDDKDTTDTLERTLESKEMAMNLGNK
ncbi:MAG: hypothetical protein J7L15_06380 [Clostridiales bacterium]|nr:hypothetical protein [Clostridiales bacterium]